MEQQKECCATLLELWTLDFGIWYSKIDNFRLCGYTNSDWASSLDDRRTFSANLFTLGSSVVSWSSTKQATTSLSTSKTEYIATSSADCQAVWLSRVLADLQQEQRGETEIFCDNNKTISMTKNSTLHSRTKHIDIRYHFICDMVAKEEILLEYCSKQEQLADVLTKASSEEKFCYFRGFFGVCSFESRGNVKK